MELFLRAKYYGTYDMVMQREMNHFKEIIPKEGLDISSEDVETLFADLEKRLDEAKPYSPYNSDAHNRRQLSVKEINRMQEVIDDAKDFFLS
jgi:hypothetical protein